eukprot:3757002-Amphidinium_carterae.1
MFSEQISRLAEPSLEKCGELAVASFKSGKLRAFALPTSWTSWINGLLVAGRLASFGSRRAQTGDWF